MKGRLIVYILGVTLMSAASIAAIADQSGAFVDIHEIPPFICDRVELVAELGVVRSAYDINADRNDRTARDDRVPTDRTCGAKTVSSAS